MTFREYLFIKTKIILITVYIDLNRDLTGKFLHMQENLLRNTADSIRELLKRSEYFPVDFCM